MLKGPTLAMMSKLCGGSKGWFSYAFDTLSSFPYGKTYFTQPALIPLSKELLARGDDLTSNTIIAMFESDATFGGARTRLLVMPVRRAQCAAHDT